MRGGAPDLADLEPVREKPLRLVGDLGGGGGGDEGEAAGMR